MCIGCGCTRGARPVLSSAAATDCATAVPVTGLPSWLCGVWLCGCGGGAFGFVGAAFGVRRNGSVGGAGGVTTMFDDGIGLPSPSTLPALNCCALRGENGSAVLCDSRRG